jgi:dihydroorotase-like cyclic amidohydrolase
MIVVVRGGTVVRPGSAPAEADVVIEDGVIAAITGPGEALDAGGATPR